MSRLLSGVTPARFLVRFDDLSPRMNWSVWEEIEEILLKYRVRPILAVVPDNRDPSLQVDPSREDFWERVRQWQGRGWSIALHGYQHLYLSESAGLVGLRRKSEFAGLPRGVQQEKLDAACAIFAREGVRADLWVAPGHSFDATTLDILLEQGIDTVSDGFGLRPVRERGINWVPQQLWNFRPFPLGVWTVCLHHNRWSGERLQRFRVEIEHYAGRLTALPELLREPLPKSGLIDRLSAASLKFSWHARHRLRGDVG